MHKVYSNIAGDAQTKTLQHIHKVWENTATYPQSVLQQWNSYAKYTRILQQIHKVN